MLTQRLLPDNEEKHDPQAEGYNAGEHVKDLEAKLEVYKRKYVEELKAKYISERTENVFQFLTGDRAQLILTTLAGAGLMDYSVSLDCGKQPNYLILLGTAIAALTFFPLSRGLLTQYAKYKSSGEMLVKILDDKKIISKNTHRDIYGSALGWGEKVFNIAGISWGIWAAVTFKGDFGLASQRVGIASAAAVLGSMCNYGVKYRQAEEMWLRHTKGALPFNPDKIHYSPAFKKSIGTGLVGLATSIGLASYLANQLVALSKDKSDHSAEYDKFLKYNYAAWFLGVVSALLTFALPFRFRGDDYINEVIDRVGLAADKFSADRLKSKLVGLFPSRATLDDFLCVGIETGVLGFATQMLKDRQSIGYTSAAIFGLVALSSIEGTVHLLSRTRAKEAEFWLSVERQEPGQNQVVAFPDEKSLKKQIKEDGCCADLGEKISIGTYNAYRRLSLWESSETEKERIEYKVQEVRNEIDPSAPSV